MANLDMKGSFTFNLDTIDKKVVKNIPGNYALGRKNKNGNFVVKYIGRSDDDLYDVLCKQLSNTQYDRFKFSIAKTANDAYEKECRNFHDFGGSDKLKNKKHPLKPYEGFKCPICGK